MSKTKIKNKKRPKEKMVGPAYRIETEHLIIRCYNPIDATLLKQSIDESIEHLKPWMPWVTSEPEELHLKIERLRNFRADFDLGKQYVFGIFNKDETKLVGGSGLHPRIGDNALEIGYWITKSEVNKGYATESSKALTKIAFDVENVKRVEIHCDPNNSASASIPKKLGYKHEATLRKRQENWKGKSIDSMIWSLLKEEYEKSSIKDYEINVFDVVGNII